MLRSILTTAQWFRLSRFVPDQRAVVFLALGLGLLLMLSSSGVSLAQGPDEGVVWEKSTQIPSPDKTSSWFPDLAVDSQDRVHVVWNETDHFGLTDTNLVESVYYSVWDGEKWAKANDILPPRPDIIRNAIAVDGYNTLHLSYGWLEMLYKRAPADEAFSAATWSAPSLINTRNLTYLKDIRIYKDTIHVVYDDRGGGDEESECITCADIFYRHSLDRGLTWSAPQPLFPSDGIGSARAQLEVDKNGTVYVTWDDGWDRFSNYTSDEKYGVYLYSTDGGDTWSSPLMVTYPVLANFQLTVGSDGAGGVMLVWRTESTDYPGIYYMWSKDYGATWGQPRALPNINSRFSRTPFDRYDMVTDSAGHIHLLVVGHLGSREAAFPGLYHFEWDGQAWSEPTALYENDWYPEYPHLVVHEGNQLHATWFIRRDVFQPLEPHQIWYAHGQSSAPAVAPEIRPTATPTLIPAILITPTPTPTPTSLPTPTPTLDPLARDAVVPEGATESIYTDLDDVLLIGLSLVPALIVISLAVIVARGWRR